MQINYPNENVRRSTASFWWVPTIENSLQAMDTPVVYAPYGTAQFWPNGTVRGPQNGNSVLNVPDKSLAPNSAQGNTVAGAAIASGFGDAPPAASPAAATASGQNIGPVSLVAPMPSITASPQAPAPPPIPCNSVNTWVSENPMLAALSVLGVYFFLGGHK